MLSVEQTNKAIEAGLANREPTWDMMLAAIEGATMGACYLIGFKADSQFIAQLALRSLVESVEQHQNGVC